MSKNKETDHLLGDEAEPIEEKPESKIRPRGRQGDQNRPICPYCSTEDNIVLSTSHKTGSVLTIYRCPNHRKCGFQISVTRPDAKTRYLQMRAREAAERGVASR